MSISLKEYWDKERTLFELKKAIKELSSAGFSLINAYNPFIIRMVYYHFNSWTKAVDQVVTDKDIERFRKIWQDRRRKEKLTKRKLKQQLERKIQKIALNDAVTNIIKMKEFLQCKTKHDVRLLAIRAYGHCDIHHEILVDALWTELSKYKRKMLGYDYDGEVIDAIEYTRPALFGKLGEYFFELYAKHHNWAYEKSDKLLMEMLDLYGKPKDKWITTQAWFLYEYAEKLLQACFEVKTKNSYKNLMRGIPDYVAWTPRVLPEKIFFVEVKAERSQLSKIQHETFEKIRRQFDVYIFRVDLPDDIMAKVNLIKQ